MAPLTSADLRLLLTRLADRGQPRSEATVQADVRQLLLGADRRLGEQQVVDLETPIGDRRRIDVEAAASIAALDLAEDAYFVGLRRRVREHLAASDAGLEIDELVTELMGL